MKKLFYAFCALLALPLAAAERKVAQIDLGEVKNGLVFFTFDDRNFHGWQKAVPIFRKYNARVTFFVCGNIDRKAADVMKKLQREGHSVGLHSQNHSKTPELLAKLGAEKYLQSEIFPQLEACRKAGINAGCFAYPFSQRTAETDALLGKYFKRYRTGISRADLANIMENKSFFLDIADLKNTPLMPGAGIGSSYNTTPELMRDILTKAARENKAVVFYSHDISDTPDRVSMSFEMLEYTLRLAQELGVKVVSFSQIP